MYECAHACVCVCVCEFARMHIPCVKATPLEYSDSKERQAYYAQFKRLGAPFTNHTHVVCTHAFSTTKQGPIFSVTTTLRQIGGEVDREIPSTLVDAWATACKTKCKAAKNKLFQAWLQAGGDWGMFHGCSNCLKQIQSSKLFFIYVILGIPWPI